MDTIVDSLFCFFVTLGEFESLFIINRNHFRFLPVLPRAPTRWRRSAL